jgi:4-carboxymuconolactone decarboxylase
MSDDLYQRGLTIRREVLGDAHVDRSLAGANDLTRDFQRLITEIAWGSVWTRPGLDVKTRSMLTIAMLAALGRHEELTLHVRATRNTGVTRAEIVEIVIQSAIYAGVPAANSALQCVQEALAGLETEEPR